MPAVAVLFALGGLHHGCATSSGDAKPTLEEKKLSANESVELRRTMVQRLVEQGDYDRALPFLKALLAERPRDMRLHLLLGIVLREKGIYQPARAELNKVLSAAPNSPAGHAAMGVLLDKTGEHAAAERHHRRALALTETAEHHNNLGFCLFLQRRYDEARGELEQAIRLDPAMRRAFNNLGFVHGVQGEREAALQAFRQAGSPAMAWTNLGVAEEMRGQPQMARRCYEKALRAQQDYKPALRNLRALERQKEPEAGENEEE